MRQDIKGKIFVAMIISVVAFGLATGAGIFIGQNPLSSVDVMNLTKQGEFPTIYTTPNNIDTSNNQETTNTTTTTETTTNPTQTNIVKTPSTSTTTNKSSSSNTSSNNNASKSGG
jgi:hypothetical protein